jgi:hypothetical protein
LRLCACSCRFELRDTTSDAGTEYLGPPGKADAKLKYEQLMALKRLVNMGLRGAFKSASDLDAAVNDVWNFTASDECGGDSGGGAASLPSCLHTRSCLANEQSILRGLRDLDKTANNSQQTHDGLRDVDVHFCHTIQKDICGIRLGKAKIYGVALRSSQIASGTTLPSSSSSSAVGEVVDMQREEMSRIDLDEEISFTSCVVRVRGTHCYTCPTPLFRTHTKCECVDAVKQLHYPAEYATVRERVQKRKEEEDERKISKKSGSKAKQAYRAHKDAEIAEHDDNVENSSSDDISMALNARHPKRSRRQADPMPTSFYSDTMDGSSQPLIHADSPLPSDLFMDDVDDDDGLGISMYESMPM